MEAKELRIGNYLNFHSNIEQVKSIDSDWIRLNKSDSVPVNALGLKPIELTEEWILKFGFKKSDDQKFYHEKYDRTWVSLDSILVKWYGNALGGIMMLDYVHQLQNIFKLLTGEELTIND